MIYTNMSKPPVKRKELIKIISVYTLMTLAVVTIVTFVFFFVLGFRFNVDDGKIEQYSFLQFDTSPIGATVTVDGALVSSKTPNKSTVREGRHTVVMTRDGYQAWTKTVNTKAGTITWLSYALLIPSKINVSSVVNYNAVYSSLASLKGRSMLVQERADLPIFDLADLTLDKVKSTQFTVPNSIYSQAGVTGVKHTFAMISWDDGGRYVLIKHTYGDKDEWLVLDTQDVNLTKNITRLLNISVSSVYFSGTSGNDFYALNLGDIRKLDLSAGTMSKPLVSNVNSFSVYNSNIITYIGTDLLGSGKQIAGLYREGDSSLHVLRTATSVDSVLHIATAHYYDDNYIVISEGKSAYIIKGNYPNTVAENTNSMKPYATLSSDQDIQSVSFSPTAGQYVLIQSGTTYASYDLETKIFTSSITDGNVNLIKWIDKSNLWSDQDGKLTIREFDGQNSHIVNSVVSGQSVTLTDNGRYLYSISKSNTGFQLQRVLMIVN